MIRVISTMIGSDDSGNRLRSQTKYKMRSTMIGHGDSDNRLRYQTIMDDGSESDGDDVEDDDGVDDE